MRLTDTHCHLIDEKYTQTPDELIAEWKENNGGHMFVIGTDVYTSCEIAKIANKYQDIHAIVGIHPEYAQNVTKEDLQTIENLAKDATAIGEIGLDFYYGKEYKDVQIAVFKAQLDIAKRLNKPICIHTREAMELTINILKEYPEVKGVIHCFSGSKESAKTLVKMGYLIGVGGIATFKNGRQILETISEIGLKNIVLETDAPYLTPEPFRGKTNKPMYVKFVAQKVAEILNLPLDIVLQETEKNAKFIYKIEN